MDVTNKQTAKQNRTPGLGIEYEVYVPAYYTLLLNIDPEIEDFKLQSNAEDFGNLDDLLIDIETIKGENFYFAFQLKHKEKSNKNILPTNFEASGVFNLEKYCETFKKFNEETRKKYHFILYTNKNFDSSRTEEVKKFNMKQDEYFLGRIFFDTSNGGKHLYKFEVNEDTDDGKNVKKDDFREFFSKFSLYTGQASIRKLEELILNILKYKESFTKYIHFFRQWHRGDFTDFKKKNLNKKTLNIHLVDMLLSSVAINYHLSDGQDEASIFFETMVRQFDITIIDASKQDFIKLLAEDVLKYPEDFSNSDEIIKLGKINKFLDRFAKELKEETKLKLLHYFYQKPLILDFNESSKDLIYEASRLCRIQEIGIKLIILGHDVDLSKFSHLRTFTRLRQVDRDFGEEIKRRCSLSLQGRNISLEDIFEDEIREFVAPKEIFQMLKGCFSVGEEKEILPQCYIPRTVAATVFDIQSIIKDSSSNEAIIFCCKDNFENLKTTIERIVEHEDVIYEDFLDTTTIMLKRRESLKDQLIPTIILTKEECSKQKFDKIRDRVSAVKKEEQSLIDKLIPKILTIQQQSMVKYMGDRTKKNEDSEARKYEIHLFKVVNEKKCLLLMSTKGVSSIENYKSTKLSVDEDDIHVFFNNSVNILCAQPGMGKSALMRCLKNKCDPSFWTVRVDLKAHNHFFKRNQEIEDVLNYFLQRENCQDLFLLNVKEMFLRKKKIVFFLDGLDEVENECVDSVLNIARQLSEMGFKIWLSSRQNLQQKIENYFNIFAIEIDEINENQQKKYIEMRLTSRYKENELEEIVKKIFNNTDLASNCQILEIPLQLHIITEAFISDESHYSNLSESNFILTKMFEIFLKGKYKHYLAKVKAENPHLLGGLEEKLEKYEIIALHSVLDDEHLQKLQIEKLKPTQIKNSDCLSIITGVNDQNKAEFEHLTYAEYFASKFLVKNFDKARILTEEIFSKKYQNMFFIFNIMLADSSPLHLAIIYKDVDQIRENEEHSLVDKGGRNILQLAACFATRHPSLKCDVRYEGFPFNKTKFVVVKDSWVKHFKGEDSKIKEIVDSAVLSSDPFKIDEIFKWNSLDYAVAAGALYVVEEILMKSETPPNFYQALEKYYSDEVISYYSIRFGYHRLLSVILAKKTCNVWSIHSDCLRDVKQLNQLLNSQLYSNFWAYWNKFFGIFPIFAILAGLGAFLYLDQKKTTKSILRFSMLPECANRTKIVELLIGDGINKTLYKDDNFTLLHLAVIHEDTEIVKFLLDRGADVNIKDTYGRSPLFLATSNSIDQTQLLYGIEANVSSSTNQNETLLSSTINSCYEWNVELMILLLNKGADIEETDQMLEEPLTQLAAKKGFFDLVSILIDKGANWNEETFLHAIYGGNTQVIDLFLGKGVDLSRVIALYENLRNTSHDHGEYSMKNGADGKFQDGGYTILHEASVMGYVKLVEDLLNNPETAHLLHAKTKKGATFLHLAVYSGEAEVVKYVFKRRIDLNRFDIYNDEYPLHFAAKDGRLQEELLIKMTLKIEKLRRNNIIYHKMRNIVQELIASPVF